MKVSPAEERYIGKIVNAAIKKSRRTPHIMTFGRIAQCLNEAGKRLQSVGYTEANEPQNGRGTIQ